jgi:DNA-directed RNA polymerase specialized sigma24 family protein
MVSENSFEVGPIPGSQSETGSSEAQAGYTETIARLERGYDMLIARAKALVTPEALEGLSDAEVAERFKLAKEALSPLEGALSSGVHESGDGKDTEPTA